ncbi:MAG: C13 family peptidase [Dokdonella sp.]|uniref:C13 family peptidase n=1 Tax=Dokdonella sp. TaxID=2291710 RepID=UPI003262E887
MNPLASTLLDGFRAVLLRHPRGTTLTSGAGVFLGLVVLYFAVTLGITLIDTEAPWRFDPTGVLVVATDSLLTLFAAWILIVLAKRRGIAWGASALLLAATVVTQVLIHWPLAHAATALFASDHVALAYLVELVSFVWWFLVLLVIAHWLAPRSLARVLVAAVLAYAVSAASWWWLPQRPMLDTVDTSADVATSPDDDADSSAAVDKVPAQTHDDESEAPVTFDAEAVMYDQPALLDAAIAKLTPQTPGKVDLYVVAFAGDAEEDVFRNESEYAERLFRQRYDATGHVIVLQNNAATVATRPLATWTNLHRALEAIARRMDPGEDVVLVYLTSHGSEDHQLLVDLDPLPLNQIAPEDLADALKTSPSMRWKVIVVNACYSGGFIDALRDDSTMVMTSARADRTSFGCGSDSDLTYFGKAFLVDALNRTTSLRDAFDLAKKSVGLWEVDDKETPSEPQIATSPSIEAKLAAWQRGVHLGASVPFRPAPKTDAGTETRSTIEP